MRTTIVLFCCIISVNCTGLLLLYRPRDVSYECAFSRRLRYDISFGMGMSDTITLIFRTLNEIDYECSVEIATASRNNYIILVMKYPTTLGVNCDHNKNAFTVMKKKRCLRLCDLIGNRDELTPYYVSVVKGKVRFRFISNSSINADINAHLYQVTATSARAMPSKGCSKTNESVCGVSGDEYCFTSGVVCDGINNCGVPDWFDERKSECGLPVEKLGFGPVFAVLAAMLCALLAAGHILLRCLPSLANSYFIFNANEDNRLCINPILKPQSVCMRHVQKAKNNSLIPVSGSSSSSLEAQDGSQHVMDQLQSLSVIPTKESQIHDDGCTGTDNQRKTTMRTMTEKIQEKIRAVRDMKTPTVPKVVNSEKALQT